MAPSPNPLALEEATLATWRAKHDETRFGWRFLAEDGITGRVNAVWPLAWSGDTSLSAAIEAAETWYAARGLPVVFKLSDGAVAPQALPEALQARGYAPHSETLVMTRAVSAGDGIAALTPAGLTLSPSPEGAFDAVLAATAVNPDDLAERRAIIARTPSLRAFAVLPVGPQPAAVGLTALAPGGLAGVFAMRTEPAFRRQGLARVVLEALARFAAAQGAATLFLQVEAANAPAVALYRQAGFATAYAYRYWRRA